MPEQHLEKITPGVPEGRTKALVALCYERKPKRILEIGTWNGRTAAMMCVAANAKDYVGFDLFELANQALDKREDNLCYHYAEKTVFNILKSATDTNITLIKGDTRETLPAFKCDTPFDLIFVDGGQSEETIKSDLLNVAPLLANDGILIVDNFRTPATPGFGVNALNDGWEPLSEGDNDERGFKVQQLRVK